MPTPEGRVDTTAQSAAGDQPVAIAAEAVHLRVADYLTNSAQQALRFQKAGLS